jgi:hypothetical protein
MDDEVYRAYDICRTREKCIHNFEEENLKGTGSLRRNRRRLEDNILELH